MIRCNDLILAHFRFFFETIRPEICRYFVESDTDETQFSHGQRSIACQRS